ncbi:protein arginine N-methyltransferase 7-like isoform X1 [Acropora millepora]|uniref:protein arginine N-methyltransferase 7-like isoform X1 n=1 Tax=Acropora millepora TaxID=45264 RepID=UPI001CF5B655|nr:protein arginine N-methyltransferase 7-like isoform X1 [Acropora millepora]
MRTVSFLARRNIHLVNGLRNEMFSQRFSPVTGKMEWIVEDEDYDMRNEIARSAYTDMLHDDERNEKYYHATMKAVRKLKGSGEKKIHMLDIGTGTGLLAMMAVRSGADGATACEAFGPIANVAKKIVAKNGFGEKISVIGKCSTDLDLERDGHIPRRANLLVTELWDTELIGEGALPTLRDACRRLLEPGFVSVPAAATIVAQVIGSETLWKMHQLDTNQISEDQEIKLPSEMEQCRGTASVFDLHVDELSDKEIHLLSEPVPVLRFDFCNNFASEKSDCVNRVSIPSTQDKIGNDQTVSQFCAETSVKQSGVGHCIVMWWTLDMDRDGEIKLTTAPRWAHPDGINRQWRDHWMQGVYFFKRPLSVQEGETLNIQCCHDDYSIWFDATPQTKIASTVDRPLCTCGAHITWSRHRIAMLNDRRRSKVFRQALKQLAKDGNSRCLCVGDGSLLPVMAARAGFEKVLTFEPSALYQKFLRKVIKLNNLEDKIEISGHEATSLRPQDLPSNQVDVILGEPFFSSALFPWHNLYFWYAASSLANIVKPGAKVVPGSATLRAIAVEFEDLWKFHAPVKIVQGFDVSLFNELIEGSKLTNEEINSESSRGIALEPHHLWEYPCCALSRDAAIMKFDFTSNIPSQKITSEGDIELSSSGTLHGIVLWMDFHLTDKLTVSTGLEQREELGGKRRRLPWVRHTKQGVYFMRSPPRIPDESLLKDNSPTIRYSVHFEPTTGEMEFDFHLRTS